MAENEIDRREFEKRFGFGALGALVALALGSASCSYTDGEEIRGHYSGEGMITDIKNCDSGCGRFEGEDMLELSVRYSAEGETIEDKVVGHRLAYGALAEGQNVTVHFGRVYEIRVVGGPSQRRDYIQTDRYRIRSVEAD